MKSFEKLFPYFLIAGILLNVNGLLNGILEPDGALYATISKHIALTGEWFNLYGNGHDWLDKPHFPFWMAAFSFKLFGITSFAYKLPAFIFWLAGIVFIFKLANELYNTITAKVAVVIYIFSLHNILNNFDVRAEPYLTTLIIAAIYYFYKSTLSGRWSDIILVALMSACAVMTKGIFALITIGGGFVIYWIITKQWKQFINYRWWLMLLLILLFITPELYSLYVQFDLHPEKVVFGKTNVSGLRFFFWDSQFGRFFNTGPIKGHGDPTFFLHTTLWAFLPWSIILYIAVIQLLRKKSKKQDQSKWIIYGSAALTFIIFSFSGFQLPFYIVILFPHFSIIAAAYLTSLQTDASFKKIAVFQNTVLIIATLFVCALAFYSHFGNVVFLAIISATIVILNFNFFKPEGINRTIIPGIAFSFVLFLFLHNFFYPNLLTYQSGMMAGKWLVKNKEFKTPAMFNSWSYSFEFYAPGYVERLETIDDLNRFLQKDPKSPVYTSLNMLDELKLQGFQYHILHEFSDFHISMLTPAFLNPHTRNRELEKKVLITVEKKL
ncbi:ArnT family glycosyltransferase [Segetibacter koreensis]|uniref:ArnT family glycosyltransferase n=1 Tax=Segetibacter koreensis TaxID=398037 RepID=UPI0003802C78|nr:glycosyltransferase family 39 protein [Segetibacter koreensis]